MSSIQDQQDRGFAPSIDVTSASSSNLLCRLLDRALIHLREYKRYKEINDEYSQALQLYLFISSAQSFLDLGGGDKCLSQRANIVKESTLPTNAVNQSLKSVIDFYTGIANALRKKIVQDRQRFAGSSGGSGTVLPKTVCDATKVEYVKGSEACQFWFDTIIGLEKAKNELKNAFLNPLLYPNLYPGVSKGILLYGSPGTGKTLLAKAAVNELTAKGEGCIKVLFFAPQGSDLKGKFVGESEAKIEAVYKCAQEAAEALEDAENLKGNNVQVISIVFLDEVESVAPSRSNDSTGINATTVNALLQQIDGIKTSIKGRKVFTWANTNYPWLLDSAFLRRFDSSILIDLPSESDIFEQLNLALSEYITGKTSKVIAPTGEKAELDLSEGCSLEDAKKEIFSWQQQKYSKYVKVEVSSLSAVAKYCFDNRFSGSDVKRFFNDVIRNAADQALLNNWFFKLNVDSAGKIVEQEVPKPIYISTLSLTPNEIEDAKKKSPDSLQRLQTIKRGRFERIEMGLFGTPFQGTKAFLSRDEINDPRIVFNDPIISNLYVEEGYQTMETPFFLYEFQVSVIQNNDEPVPESQRSSPLYQDADTLSEEELYIKYSSSDEGIESLGTLESFNIPFKRDKQKFYFLTQFKKGWIDAFKTIASSAASAISGSVKGTTDLASSLLSSNKATANKIVNLKKSVETLRNNQAPKNNNNPKEEIKEATNDIINIQTATQQIFANGGYLLFGNLNVWSITGTSVFPNFDFFEALSSIGDLPASSPLYARESSVFDPNPSTQIGRSIREGLYGTFNIQTFNVPDFNRFEYTESETKEQKRIGICDGKLIEKNSRYLNWAINQSTWNSSMLKIKSTIDKKLYETLKKYERDPDTVLREQGNK